MQKCNSHVNDKSVEPENEDTVAAEKKKLLQDIQELKYMIKECEWNLQTLRFKDVEKNVAKKYSKNLEVSPYINKKPSIEVDLQTDLYRFAGFRCIKSRRNEFIFNFSSMNSELQDDTHAVQIFIKENKGNLGKWVMPMSIDMNYILSKAPIDELKNIPIFIKSCKHNIDCYTVRQEQYLKLEKHISHMKHCTLQSDIGFMQIILKLYGVHDTEKNVNMNLTIYLLYHSDKARPYKIEIGTCDKNKLNDSTKDELKLYFKEFKISDLQTAFHKILTDNNSKFTWMQTDDSESPLELNNTSSSDENFLAQLQSKRKRSMRKLRKKRILQKKWNERRRQRNVTKIQSSDDTQDDTSKANSRTTNPQRIPVKKKRANATSVLKQKRMYKISVEDTTPMYKVKLRQTKLNFQTEKAMNSNTNELSFESKLHNRSKKKQLKINHSRLITSTPLHVRKSSSPNLNNSTFIETTKKAATLLENSTNSDLLDNKKRKRITKKK